MHSRLLLISLMVIGCSAQRPIPPQLNAPIAPPPPAAEVMPESPPLPPEPEVKAPIDPDVLAALEHYQSSGKTKVYRKGTRVLYPYPMPEDLTIPCPLARAISIVLQQGEVLNNLILPDQGAWWAQPGVVGEGETLRAVVVVKPTPAAEPADLTLLTNRRIYHLNLVATGVTGNETKLKDRIREATFYYLEEVRRGE